MNTIDSKTAIKLTVIAAATLIFSLLCSMIISIYALILFKSNNTNFSEVCTISVNAVISDNIKGGENLYPVYVFSYNGNEYTAYGNEYASKELYSPGDKADILIEPDNPYHIYDPANDGIKGTLRKFYISIAIRGAAVLAVIIAAIITVMYFRKDESQQDK